MKFTHIFTHFAALFLVAALAFVLCACESRQPKPQIVEVPVSVGCLENIPEKPVLLFDDLPPAENAVEEAEQVRVLWKDRQAAWLYGVKWEAAAAGCQLKEQPAPGN
jgi:ABC-type uncharacterized transport system auxiliary subunit